MARYRATIQGTRGQASRLGTPQSGIRTTTNGWDVGVTVFSTNTKDEPDTFEIVATGGSHDGGRQVSIGRVTIVNGMVAFVRAPKMQS